MPFRASGRRASSSSGSWSRREPATSRGAALARAPRRLRLPRHRLGDLGLAATRRRRCARRGLGRHRGREGRRRTRRRTRRSAGGARARLGLRPHGGTAPEPAQRGARRGRPRRARHGRTRANVAVGDARDRRRALVPR